MGGNYVFCFSNKINKDADLKLPTVLRNRVRHMCFLWILKNFKAAYFKEYMRTAASENWQDFIHS